MSLSQNLQNSRTDARLTQQQVADVLNLTRESISMWEKGTRVPGLRQLEELARLYSVSVEFLLDKEKAKSPLSEREVLCRGLVSDPVAHLQLIKWFDFLDNWAELKEAANLNLGNSGKPPKKLDRGPDFTDSRAVPTLAAEVRSHFGLGTDAITDLYSFLDEQGILVCKANLGNWSDQTHPGISGAFHNHPKLGYCILVNSQNSLGRQSFTLAHEFGHALFHYNARAIISINKDGSPREFFADSFANHFLVPSKELNKLINTWQWENRLDPLKAIELAYIFRVSYAFMLIRLRNEKHITEELRKEWSEHSPSALAEQLGLETDMFCKPRNPVLSLHRYPPSVLQTVRDLIKNDELYISQAADLLDVSQAQLKSLMLSDIPSANENEKKEVLEFSQ